MLWPPFWSIFIHFVAFWWTLFATKWPLHDFYRLLSPFKCPSYLEKDHISHSGRIGNSVLCHAMVSILVLVGACWCTSCATPWPLHDLYWLLYPFKCPCDPEKDHISHLGQIQTLLLCHDMVTIFTHFGPFWCTSWAAPRLLSIKYL